jgi:arylformamidase
MNILVQQVERAVAKILKDAGDSEVYICGHSAGAHLASLMLYVDFEKKYQVKTSSIKGLFPVSGVFKLEPLIKTDINDNLKMDSNLAIKLSPLLLDNKFSMDTSQIRVLLAYGEEESVAFKQQSIEYFQLLEKASFKSLRCIEINNCDHFNVIENLSEDDFSLTRVNFCVECSFAINL